MKFLTANELIEWCASQGVVFDDDKKPKYIDSDSHCARFVIPELTNRLMWFCRFVDEKLQPRDRCLLWVTDWGVWESSENWHLYYRLRQSYGDLRFLEDAPGHLFLNYERQDLVSFLQIGLSAGWDIHLIPSQGYARCFISHDGWIEFSMVDQVELSKIANELAVLARKGD